MDIFLGCTCYQISQSDAEKNTTFNKHRNIGFHDFYLASRGKILGNEMPLCLTSNVRVLPVYVKASHDSCTRRNRDSPQSILKFSLKVDLNH